MMFKTTEDVAQEFRRRYRRDPYPEAWDLAAGWQWIEDVIDDPAEVASVFARVRALENLRRQPRAEPREARRELAPDRRAIALAQIRAIEAAVTSEKRSGLSSLRFFRTWPKLLRQ